MPAIFGLCLAAVGRSQLMLFWLNPPRLPPRRVRRVEQQIATLIAAVTTHWAGHWLGQEGGVVGYGCLAALLLLWRRRRRPGPMMHALLRPMAWAEIAPRSDLEPCST